MSMPGDNPNDEKARESDVSESDPDEDIRWHIQEGPTGRAILGPLDVPEE